ncbi:MAG TPA: cytochrome C [Microvirga sp.]|jgi:cytochrome c553|nr:cytochrome C [Microvirga sp.]
MRATALMAFASLGCAAAPALAQPAVLAPPGVSACSGCHVAPGAGVATTIPPIHGRDAAEIVAAMQEFRSGQRPATVMDRLSRGFSDDEVRAIAAWLSAQR